MQRKLSRILIPLILASIILAPISASIKIGTDNSFAININRNVANAQVTTAETNYRAAYTAQLRAKAKLPPLDPGRLYQTPEEKAYLEAKAKADAARVILEAEPTGKDRANAVTQSVDKQFEDAVREATENDYELGCSAWTGKGLGGCVAGLFWIIWQLSANTAHLGGRFLDYFIYYSISDDSYRNAFVDNGWAAIRDIANIFFILALLYVALQTVLSLHGANTKKMLGMIIIFALLINFSLFVTKVVIDASNVLAKIFYNNINSVNENGTPAIKDGGEKSISIGIVDKFNPQQIINHTAYDAPGGTTKFIFVTIILILITFYAAYIFFSVAILFVGRVVSLWLAMIFSPIAFASKAFEKDLGAVGMSHWSEDLLKNAMMAPIFIFMLYIIILFMNMGATLIYTDSSDLIQTIMATVIPFAVVFILLHKAKELAVKLSTEVGAKLKGLGDAIGGFAVGGSIGTMAAIPAIAGRVTLGRLGSAMEKNSWINNNYGNNFVARWGKNIGEKLGSSSFDFRNVKVGGKDLAGATGMSDINKSTISFLDTHEGGFLKMRADKLQKRLKRAKSLEVNEDEESTLAVRRAEVNLQTLLREFHYPIEQLDKRIKTWRERAVDARRACAAGLDGEDSSIYDNALARYLTNDEAQERSEGSLVELNAHRSAIKDGRDFTPTAVSAIHLADVGRVQAYGTIARVGGVATGATINNLEDDIIPDAKHHKDHISKERKRNLQDYMGSDANKFINGVMTLGQHSSHGADEAQHKILMDAKEESHK